MAIYVNYGCGDQAPANWLNFDASPVVRLRQFPLAGKLLPGTSTFPDNVQYGDIVRGLPIAAGTVKGVFASHVLEHLSRDQFCIALENTFRMLSPRGIFRLIVPDLQIQVETYRAHIAAGREDANDFFLRTSALGLEQEPRTIQEHLRYVFGRTSRHHWMWDWPSIKSRLQDAGFTGIRQCAYRDCSDPAFADVESPDRFDWSVAAEAVKP